MSFILGLFTGGYSKLLIYGGVALGRRRGAVRRPPRRLQGSRRRCRPQNARRRPQGPANPGENRR